MAGQSEKPAMKRCRFFVFFRAFSWLDDVT
jgi:hypothetical protein